MYLKRVGIVEFDQTRLVNDFGGNHFGNSVSRKIGKKRQEALFGHSVVAIHNERTCCQNFKPEE